MRISKNRDRDMPSSFKSKSRRIGIFAIPDEVFENKKEGDDVERMIEEVEEMDDVKHSVFR